MKQITQLLFFITILFFSSNAFATYTCTGKVSGVTINPSQGRVLVESVGGLVWVELCSVEKIFNNINPETCKQIYSLLLTAQTAKKEVMFWFNDENSGMNCSNHPSWQLLTGWYFGPRLID